MIKVGIVEDIFQLGIALKEKVELAPEFSVQFIAANGEDVQVKLKDHEVDVLLMDINMPKLNGVEATKIITKEYPDIKVVMCTVFSDEQNLFDAIMAGAIGYLLKDEPPVKIHRSLYEAIEGGAPMSAEMARKSLKLVRTRTQRAATSLTDEYQLTAREIEVLECVSRGNSYEQVADKLFISYGTVRKHVENCYKKLRVHSKIEAFNKLNKAGFFR
jgi:DNA-binding NarL/FixJ family response regulator